MVPESSSTKLSFNSFPLGDHHTGYYTGGDSIIDANASWNHFSFQLQPRKILATQVSDLFKVKGLVSFKSTNTYSISNGTRFGYGGRSRDRRGYLTFKLEGFWSESSGKVCMVGTSSGDSKRGNSFNLDAVLKLNNVFNASNISSLVSGSLESLSSKKDENYFQPFSLFMFPKANYKYTLDSIEVDNDFSKGIDAEQGLSLNLNKLSFCSSYSLGGTTRALKLEYSSDCNSAKNCTPISGSSGQLPSIMSLDAIECTHTNEKHRLRVVVAFFDISYWHYNPSFNPKTMLVGEGWWDEKKNSLCVVACHIIGMESSSDGTNVSDCSVRLRLRFPSIWSINYTSTIEGQIWSNKTAKGQGYFKRITFRNEYDDYRVRGEVHGLKYEYSQLDRVKQLCQTPKDVKDKGKRYPDAYSYDMRFDMSVRESNKRVAWGSGAPLTVDDQLYESGVMHFDSYSVSSSSTEILDSDSLNNDSLFNISYKFTMYLMSYSTLSDRNSLFNLSYENVKISAEGIYDVGAGNLCMVGCRDLSSNNGTPKAHSMDCEILMKFQFPSIDSIDGSRIKGSIESRRKKSDPLYFKSLDLSATAYYTEAARRNLWRMDMEVLMALVSTTLACVFVVLQLYHVKKHPNVLPFISLIMMSVLTLGYMIPLILNFEAVLTQNPNKRNFVIGNVGIWLEVNEISVRMITMVAFLLQSRLLYLTWSSRKSDQSNKGLLIVERKAAYVTLPLYAAGLLIALLLKLKKDRDTASFGQVYRQNPSSWDNFKSYGGLVSDGFLLPQIILNLFSNMEENVLSCSFYFGTTFVRLLPHAYDLYRAQNYASQDDNGSYYYAEPSEDFYSTAWDIVIPLGGILFAIIIYLQQRFGAHYILPRRFKGSKVYEKVPDSEAEVETTNM
ncbi:hypothetical protein RIF29_39120 [Crotalaria pallida]|uniref:RING-type E3 ubiquitin transferase n=1 Tax=Crotalaria pallida TaxID=3830 RepID=A0AAN9E5Z7_CROPI